MNPLVSIIIPLYNSENYIAETIRSALAQTWANKEIIIVDDGSIDNSYSIAKTFLDNHITLVQQENQGASAARNKGIILAKGDYIQFLDADDLMKNDKIEIQINAIKNIPGAMAYGLHAHFFDGDDINDCLPGCYLNTDYNEGKLLLFDLYGGKDEKHAGSFVPQHSWLIPRSVIEVCGGWDTSLTVDDDGEYFCRIVLKSSAIKYTPGAIVYYRKHLHKLSLSAQKTYQSYLSSFSAIKLKRQHIGNWPSTDHLLANQAMHLLTNVYPVYPELVKEITQFIKKMGGATWLPYQEGPYKILRRLFGWKVVRLLNYYKNLKTVNV